MINGQQLQRSWRIGVDDCLASQEPAPSGLRRGPVVAVEAGGVATSCPAVRAWQRDGRQLHHIVVPGTGQPAEIYWAAVTVAAPLKMLAFCTPVARSMAFSTSATVPLCR